MNQREKLKAHVVGMCVKGKMTVKEGASRLKLSERQVKALKARYRENGASSVLHGNCGRQPAHTLSPELRQQILEIRKRKEYEWVNFTHFNEILSQAHGIVVSYTTLRNLLISSGYQSPKKHRKSTVKHPRRERKARMGELLQTDATPYDWFNNEEHHALHAMIDDATGNVTGLYMSANECAEGYFRVLKQTIQEFGSPLAIYADGLSLFFNRTKPTLQEQLEGKQYHTTQFEGILRQLGTSLIHARSPQAKGRVERLWGTLQSRLPVELALRGIHDVDQANAFLENEYISIFNSRFGIAPADAASAFMPRPKGLSLDTLLSLRFSRVTDQSGCFSLKGVTFQCSIPGLAPKSTVDILVNARLGVKVLHGTHLYSPVPILDKKKRQVTGSSIDAIIAQCVFDHCLKNEHVA